MKKLSCWLVVVALFVVSSFCVANVEIIGAESSSDEDDRYRAGNVFDGLKDTRWSSEHTEGESIYVDFGSVVELKKIILHWETAFAKKYELQVSDDGENWKTVYTEENSSGGKDVCVFGRTIKARYVKLISRKKATEWGISLWEFEAM